MTEIGKNLSSFILFTQEHIITVKPPNTLFLNVIYLNNCCKASGVRAGTVITSFITMAAGLVIAFIFGWKLALSLSLGVPLLAYSGYKNTALLRSNQKRDAALMEQAGKVCQKEI